MLFRSAEYEDRIIGHLDGRVPEPERREVESHLTACTACRNFAAEMGRLDTALASSFRPPALTPGFKDRVLRRVDGELIPTTSSNLLLKKQAIESEYHQLTNGLLRRSFHAHLATILDSLGYAGVALLLWFSWDLFATPVVAMTHHWIGPRPFDSAMLLFVALSAASVFIGVSFGIERWMRLTARFS